MYRTVQGTTEVAQIFSLQVLATLPKLVVVVFFSANDDPVLEETMKSLTIPFRTSFFWTRLSYENEQKVGGRCWGLYRPMITMSYQMFDMLYLKIDDNGKTWIDNSSETAWNYYGSKIFRNLTGGVIKVGVPIPENVSFKSFYFLGGRERKKNKLFQF